MELAGTFGCVVFQQHYGFSHIDDIIPVATRFFSGRLSSLAVEALPWRIVSSGAGMRLEISQAAFYFSIIFSNFVHFWYFIISDYTSRWFVVKIKEDCDVFDQTCFSPRRSVHPISNYVLASRFLKTSPVEVNCHALTKPWAISFSWAFEPPWGLDDR